MINVSFRFTFHVKDGDIELLGTWGPFLKERWVLNQVSPELSHWSNVSFTIKQLAQILFSGNLSAFCISVRLCILSAVPFTLNEGDLYQYSFIAKPNLP